MSTLLTLILPVVLAWPVVSVPKHSCLWQPFHGITQTDEIGTIIGRADRGDWGCAEDATGGSAVTRTVQGAVPVPPPTALCLRPAFPNPATFGVRFGFTLTETQPVTLVVYARETGHGPPRVLEVKRLVESTQAAGSHEIHWDLTDLDGQRVPAGLYRVVFEAGDVVLCGDLEVR
jgi:hypothetical protein